MAEITAAGIPPGWTHAEADYAVGIMIPRMIELKRLAQQRMKEKAESNQANA